MEKYFLNHMLKLTGHKIDQEGNGFVELHYEGEMNDCVVVVEELEKTAKRIMRKLGMR